MMRRVLLLLVLCIGRASEAGAQTTSVIRLAWDAPVMAPTDVPLATYTLAWGTATGVYTQSRTVLVTTRTAEVQLPPGTYFFAVRAVDTAGAQSVYSNEVRAVMPLVASVTRTRVPKP